MCIPFLSSREHDLFALLFLSDLIGHYSHIHINDRCNFTKGISKLKYYSPKTENIDVHTLLWNRKYFALAVLG